MSLIWKEIDDQKIAITIAASTLLEQAEEKLLEAVMDALDKQDISSYSHLIENESEGDPD